MPEAVALIADDDEYFRMAISAILKETFGFSEVIETGSFDEAVERLETAGRIQLAIFDLSMPGIDSPAALRSIRDLFDVNKLVVVSASRDRADIFQSLEAGAHGFVSKAQGVAKLQSALQQILDGEVYVSPAVTELSSGSQGDAPAAQSPPPAKDGTRLTPRQRQVLEMLVEGKSNKEIARALNLGRSTIKVHLAALFRNLGVSNRAAAAVAGVELLRRLSPRESGTIERARRDPDGKTHDPD